jgi:hypothetical protein
MSTGQENRQAAMKWWNGLSFEDKWYAIVKAKKYIKGYPDRSPGTLTGREIEMLHIKNIKQKP